MNKFPGEIKVYRSIDERKEVVDYPIEFLNFIKLSGLPDHKLALK